MAKPGTDSFRQPDILLWISVECTVRAWKRNVFVLILQWGSHLPSSRGPVTSAWKCRRSWISWILQVVCTLGPVSRSVDVLEKLLKAGMSVARFNFSHGSHDYHQVHPASIARAHQNMAAEHTFLAHNCSTAHEQFSKPKWTIVGQCETIVVFAEL